MPPVEPQTQACAAQPRQLHQHLQGGPQQQANRQAGDAQLVVQQQRAGDDAQVEQRGSKRGQGEALEGVEQAREHSRQAHEE